MVLLSRGLGQPELQDVIQGTELCGGAYTDWVYSCVRGRIYVKSLLIAMALLAAGIAWLPMARGADDPLVVKTNAGLVRGVARDGGGVGSSNLGAVHAHTSTSNVM
jgi:hypothetical protein